MNAASQSTATEPDHVEPGVERAVDLHARAVAAADNGQLSVSAGLLEEGLGALGIDRHGDVVAAAGTGADAQVDRDRVAARLLLSLALPAYELGSLERGQTVLDAAQAIADRLGLEELTALIHCQRGVILLRAGRPAAALADLDQAVRLIRFASPLEQCKIMMNRGDVHHALGRIRNARADFGAALDIAVDHALEEFTFRNTHNVAYMEYLAGDLPRALSLMPTIGNATSDYARGVVGMDRAKVLLSAGLLQEADATLLEACRALEQTDLVQLLAEAELARAEAALMAKNFALASELAVRAAARFRARGNGRLTDLAELVELYALADSPAEPADLASAAEALSARLAEHGLQDQSRLARLLAVEALLDATKRAPDVEIRVRAGEPINLRLRVRFTRARLAFARNDQGLARREIRTGLTELADYQAQFGSFDLQTSSATHGASLAALAVNADIEAGRPLSVLNWLERVRTISSHVPEVRPPADDVSADLLAQLRSVVHLAEEEITHGRVREDLNRQRQQLERRIRARSWTVHGRGRAARVPTPAELRSALGNATLVAIFGMDEEIHGLVVTECGSWMQRLTTMAEAERVSRRISADLDVLALDRVPEVLRVSARRSLNRGLQFLDDLLLAPLDLPDGPVVLLPPGRLAAVTWAGLPTLRGRPLTLAPSAGAWMHAHERFDATLGAAQDGSARVVAVAGPGLERADEEVREVARCWPGCQILVGSGATGDAFLASIDGARLVHVAAHGRHEWESPLFSSIRLTDGPVVGYDLDQLTEPPQQAVLSACDLGRGTVRPGDESLGLTRALLHSGTATVISGVAKVSDHGAAELMTSYHRRLAAGAAPAYALAEALADTDELIPFACFGAGW